MAKAAIASGLLISMLLLQLCKGHPDFDACWKLTQDESVWTLPGNRGYFSNQTGFSNYESSRHYITPEGCEHFCGTGFQFWPASEIAWRFALFIFPLFVLGLAFSGKPDLTIGIIFFTFLHLVGDPIDSLWSILVRQEVARRNYNLCAEMVPSASREVASILTVYDQWWQDARNHFQREMKARATRPADVRHRSLLDESSVGENTSDEDIADNQQSPRSERSTYELRNPGSGQGHHEQPPPRSLVRRCWDFICLPCGKVRTAIKEKSRRIQTIQKTDNLTLEELCVVRSISQRLAAQRSRKFFQTWVSILLFLLSVGGGYLRAVEYYERRKTSQTAHTLAIVMLFSFLLFAVYVNGHVGNFDHTIEVFAIMRSLRQSPSLRTLFPKPRLRRQGRQHYETARNRYREEGAYSGIVNSWRPDKYLRAHDIDDRSIWMLLTVSIFAVICSWVPAFTISYHTPTIGFGCRSLAWTLIVCGWVVNAACDIFGECIKWNKKSRLDFSTAALYYFSYVRDALVTLGVVSAIVTAQLGIMNNCWCRAGVTSSYIETAVEIGPPTDAMRREGSILWLAAALGGLAGIFFVIFYAGLDGENGRLLYVRSQAESMAEQRGIDLEQRWLYSQNQQPHFTAPGEMHPPAQPEEGTSLLNPATASVGYRATSNTSSPSREGSMEREPLVSR